jgi:beta-lactam-binding protein with PASTA domain
MRKQLKSKQAGISFFGLIMVMVILALVGLVGAQVFPTVIEYQSIQKAANKAAKEGTSVADVKGIFNRAIDIDNITSITANDLVITKNGDVIQVAFAYNKEIHLFGPAYLLLKYAGQSRLQTR